MISGIFVTMMTAVIIIAVVFGIIGYVLTSLGKMKCMQKAGEAGWKAWVPVYNDYVMYKITGIKKGLIAIEAVYLVVAIVYIIMTLSFSTDIMKDVDKSLESLDSSYSSYSKSKGTSSKSNTTNRISTSISSSSKNNNTVRRSSVDSIYEPDINSYIGKGMGLVIVEVIYTALSIGMLVVNIFFAIYISKSFGLGGGYIAGMILVPTIFIMIIGFGKSEYKGTYQSVKAQKA